MCHRYIVIIIVTTAVTTVKYINYIKHICSIYLCCTLSVSLFLGTKYIIHVLGIILGARKQGDTKRAA